MTFLNTQPATIQEALDFYFIFLKETHEEKKAAQIFDLTRTALTRYTLPGWGVPMPRGRKPTKTETSVANNYLQSVKLKQLINAIEAQAKVFNECSVTPNQRHTYGSKLANFISWINQQNWLTENNQSTSKNRAPRIRLGYGKGGSKKMTDRTRLSKYGLEKNRVNSVLRQELEEFNKFLLADFYPKRETSKVSPLTAEERLIRLYLILGWFASHKEKPVSDENLTLSCLIRKPKNTKKDKEAAAEELDYWLCEHLEFLKEVRGHTPKSMNNHLTTLMSLINFQFLGISHDEIKATSTYKVVNQKVRQLTQNAKQQKPVANQELKWLDLPDVLSRIVSPLREECNFRGSTKNKRQLSGIACSFQYFVMWGMMTLRPPRRQREYREAKISYSCSIEKPTELKEGQFIHPLPPDRKQSNNKQHTYLFKDLDGLWYLDAVAESFKTGKSLGDQRLEIPNSLFSNGKCFYDYLEAFIYGCYCDKKGNWISASKVLEPLLESQYYGLRAALEPNHTHLFTRPGNHNPFDRNQFSATIRDTAHRLTGKCLTPHLLRDIYATYFLDQGYTEDRIRSLAYAMGHSVEMLRKVYDRRRPQQKNRPIEEAMVEVVNQYMT
jgi:hypothetical protein